MKIDTRIVDAPTMYDATVREHKGVQYIVFNIMSFVEYKAHNRSIDSFYTGIHQLYTNNKSNSM